MDAFCPQSCLKFVSEEILEIIQFSAESVLKKSKITVIIAKSSQPQIITYSFLHIKKIIFSTAKAWFSVSMAS